MCVLLVAMLLSMSVGTGAFAARTGYVVDNARANNELNKVNDGALVMKKYSGRAQVWLTSIYDKSVPQYVPASTAYGWYEVWWQKSTASDSVCPTSKSGSDNKVYQGSSGKAIPYVNSYGQVGRSYKLALRVSTTYPNHYYKYTGQWSPDNELG